MANSANNRCRLCASPSRKLQTVEIGLSEQIGVLFQIHIQRSTDDRFPRSICPKCTSTVKTTWKFYNKVQKAQNRLEAYCKSEVKSESDHFEPEKPQRSNEFCQINIVQKVEDSNPIPETDIYDENESTTHNYDSTKSRLGSVKDCPTDSMDDEPSLAMEEERLDSGEDEPQSSSKDTWPDYPWCCNICSDKCSDVNDYRNHHCFSLHNRYFCVDCPKAYSRQPQFFAHVTEHHWERHQKHLQLQCDVCHSWFNCQAEQEVHRGLEHPEVGPRPPPEVTKPTKNELHCDLCGKRFATKSYFNFHMKKHTGEKPFVCDVCGKGFFFKHALKVHRKIHSGLKEYTCEECGWSFSEKGNLLSHMVVHTDSRPFPCRVCQKTFKTTVTLREHMSVHTGTKPHVCSDCGRTFRLRGELQRHIRVHSEKKNYQCDMCDKSFKFKNVRDVHRRQHTGEQPYGCIACARSFTDYPNCSKHMKRIHGLSATPKQCQVRPNKASEVAVTSL